MPLFTVLRLAGTGEDRLVLAPAGSGDAAGSGVFRLGQLRVPLSTRVVSLSPPILHVPGVGPVELKRLVNGDVVPGVTWTSD